MYDPGYLNTAPVRSSISYIDGDEGILRYRGYPIEELAESSTYVEVAYLLSKSSFKELSLKLTIIWSKIIDVCVICSSVWEFAFSDSIGRLGICYFSAFGCTAGTFGEIALIH